MLAPYCLRAVDQTIAVLHMIGAIAFQEDRSVEIDDLAELPDEERRRHRERGTDHVAYHGIDANLLRRAGHGESLGQATAFVELDIEYAESPYQTADIGN